MTKLEKSLKRELTVKKQSFVLTIDPSGRVIGCNITQSSGSPVLDAATCNIMRRRARYTPAMDSNGNPTAGTIEQQIEWNVPSR